MKINCIILPYLFRFVEQNLNSSDNTAKIIVLAVN